MINENRINKITSMVLREWVEEDTRMLSNGNTEIDNFDMIAGLMSSSSPDDVWTIDIKRRRKDHEKDPNDDPTQYHNSERFVGHKVVKSGAELLAAKDDIIKLCNQFGARAYIFINRRNLKTAEDYIKICDAKGWFNPGRRFSAHKDHKLQFILGQHKDDYQSRPICFLDVDKNDPYVFDMVDDILKQNNITPLESYRTLSGGKHYILPDKEYVNKINLGKLIRDKVDKGRDYGRWATAGIHYDSPLILYANLRPNNYDREQRKVKELEKLYSEREKLKANGMSTYNIDSKIKAISGVFPK